MGPKAPDPREAMGSIVFLCHASDMTLSEEQLVGACLGSGAREPPGIGSPGLSSCARALASIVSQAGAKGRALRCHRLRAQGSRKPSSPRQKLRSS
jgi:hypothetical protein